MTMQLIRKIGVTFLAILAGGLILAGAAVTAFMQNPAPLPPATTMHCPAGNAEDSCYPDYVGNGKWELREGERPLPKATIAPACNNPRITPDMVADCNKLASRPHTIDAQGNENPAGPVLVAECIESYDNAIELRECLR